MFAYRKLTMSNTEDTEDTEDAELRLVENEQRGKTEYKYIE